VDGPDLCPLYTMVHGGTSRVPGSLSKAFFCPARRVHHTPNAHTRSLSRVPLGWSRHRWQAACIGARFLDRAFIPGSDEGLLFFSTTREGHGLHFQRKPYTAVFYILACLEFSAAIKAREVAGSDVAGFSRADFVQKAVGMFNRFRVWIDDPAAFGRTPPPPGAALASSLAQVMCLAGLAEEFIEAVPEDRETYMPFVEDAMRRVRLHYDPEREIFMEEADPVKGVHHATMSSRMFNPGHSIEVSWFLLHLCALKPDAEIEAMAINTLGGALKIGWDTEVPAGGLVYIMDILGKPLLDTTVTATNKLWWPHCEALYACTLAYDRTSDPKWLEWLTKVDDFCSAYLCDKEQGGEWLGYLNRDATPFNVCKGGNYKGCFHGKPALSSLLRR
jgi:N-acylglucosamine 2-epimerase